MTRKCDVINGRHVSLTREPIRWLVWEIQTVASASAFSRFTELYVQNSWTLDAPHVVKDDFASIVIENKLGTSIAQARSHRVQAERKARCKSTSLYEMPRNPVTPVKDLMKLVGENKGIHIPPPDYRMSPTIRHKKATNSTMVHAESFHIDVPTELSSITTDQSPQRCEHFNLYSTCKQRNPHLGVLSRQQYESPAKIFARMKAKVLNAKGLSGQKTEATPQKGTYNTPRKEETYGDRHNTSFDMEAFMLSPMPTPGKVLQTEVIQQKAEKQGVFNAGLQSSQVIPSLSSESAVTYQQAVKVHSEKDNITRKQVFSTNDNNEDSSFVVPRVPDKRATFFAMLRKDSSENSPAKTFLRMKERLELRQRQQEVNQEVSSTVTRQQDCVQRCYKPSLNLTSGEEGDVELSQDTDISVAVSSSVPTMFTMATGRCIKPVPEGRTHHAPLDPAEDSLLKHSPRICIPKKAVVFQHRDGGEPERVADAQDKPANVVNLRDWEIKILNSGLYLDGIRTDNKLSWHSNIIAERISSNTVKTVSGSVYVLIGRMTYDASKSLPHWFLKKFLFGFPEKWKDYLQSYLSELKKDGSNPKQKKSGVPRETVQKSKATAPAHSTRSSPTNTAVLSTTSCHGLENGAKLSRSGRLIKPPLEYWKGARVILDSDMNVTIHDSYMSTPVPSSTPSTVKVVHSTKDTRKESSSKSSSTDEGHSKRLKRKGRNKPDQDYDTDSSKNRAVLQTGHKEVTARKVKAVRPEKQCKVPLINLNTRTQLDNSCRHYNLRFSISDSSPSTEVAGPSFRSSGPSKAPLTGNWQGYSSCDEEEQHTLQRRVKPQAQARGRREGRVKRAQYNIGLPRRQTKSQSEEPQCTTPSKTGQDKRRENQVALDAEDCSGQEPSRALKLLSRNKKIAEGVSDRIQEDRGHLVSTEDTETGSSSKVQRQKNQCVRLDSTSTDMSQDRRRLRKRRHQRSASDSDDDSDFVVPLKACILPKRSNSNRRGVANVDSRKRTASMLTSDNRTESSTENESGGAGRDDARVARKTRAARVGKKAGDARGAAYSDVRPGGFSLSPEKREMGKKVSFPQAQGNAIHEETAKPSEKKEGGVKRRKNKAVTAVQAEEDDDKWTDHELEKLHKAVSTLPKYQSGFWVSVAMAVGTHSAEECQEQYTQQHGKKVSSKRRPADPRKEQDAGKEAPQITAKVGTLKRKQQMRNFLDNLPKDDHDDVFSSSPLQRRRVKLPALSVNAEDHVFQNLGQNPRTPGSPTIPIVKTPQCLHISPGMLGTINRNDNDKYVYHLQKRMKKAWANVHSQGGSSQPDKLTLTPQAKCTRRRPVAESESFAVWEMFSDKDPLPMPSDESGEDYYFVDDD